MKHHSITSDLFSLLYVEDDHETREILSSLIMKKFPTIKVLGAANGQEGLDLFKERRIDIVVTDISMPVLNGIQMSGEIREINPDVPIIVITAHSDISYLLEAITIGISHYVMKPVEQKKFFSIIGNCLESLTLKRRLREQHDHIRKLSLAVEQSASMIMITDHQGVIEYVNPKFCTVTGYTVEELLGKTPGLLKSGATAATVYDQLWETIGNGKEWHGELLNRKKGGELYWEMMSISPMHDDDGRLTHFIAITEDITERKRAEMEISTLNVQLAAHAKELETLNQELEAFTAMVSHDLRQPLVAIGGLCAVIERKYEACLDEQGKILFSHIQEGTREMGQLIVTLLDFSQAHHRELRKEPCSLSNFAEKIAEKLRQRNPYRQATFRIAHGILVDGDPRLLQIALENLLGNAWKFTACREMAVIEFGTVDVGGKTTCFVRDNGVGFPMSKADRLFGTFQRLHDDAKFEGTGIGLATVRRIIQRHGGEIWAEGEVDKGATFFFTL